MLKQRYNSVLADRRTRIGELSPFFGPFNKRWRITLQSTLAISDVYGGPEVQSF